MDPEDELFVDPDEEEEEEEEEEGVKNLEDGFEPAPPAERREGEEEEDDDDEDDDQIFAAWMSRGGATDQPREEEKEEEEEEEEETQKIDRKTSFDPSSGRRPDRRASLPSPAQLSAMQLSRLHAATKPPSPARGVRKPRPSSQDAIGPAQPANPERRPSLITTIPEVAERLERTARFRRRNVMSLSDADRVCLICHDDLHKGGSGIRELHCSHSFHSECIEDWLWQKQACPTCRVQVPMPEPLYWNSARLKVP